MLTKVIGCDNLMSEGGSDLRELYVKAMKGKKTMKTPVNEIDKARKYMEDYIRRAA